ncbi:MAG: glycosyltransferase family 39 protein [Blastocatellia bacterium]|nr:glycosyltransferase family 39 protein [Blastocatellia bacterium]
MRRWLPLLICFIQFLAMAYLARQHPFGNFATETDFYHYYAPDAERIAAGQFPDNTFQGPGYPALLALISWLTGGDLFTIGKWLSVICAVLVGLLAFILFERLFGYWVGIGAQLIAIVSGEFPQFAINATTDLFFLLICLLALVVFTSDSIPPGWRMFATGALCGLAYLTRYNGLFLLAACLAGVLLLDLFERKWPERSLLAGFLLAAFLVVTSPWLYANNRRHGSPFYNTNYLNLATEFYPELVEGKTNQDATRPLEQKFHSFRDVLRYDARRIIEHYPVNFYESLRLSTMDNLVNPLVGGFAVLGLVLVLGGRKSKKLKFILATGLIYLMVTALTHWETRYYFLLMIFYAGLSVYAVARCFELMRARKLLNLPVAIVVSVLLVALLWALSFAQSRKDVKTFLAGQPWEIMAARDYLKRVDPKGSRIKIVARKPHLPYLADGEWIFFPQVKSIEEFREWVKANRIDYIAIGKRELKERKELSSLADPRNAPEWLKAVWVNDDPVFILYKPIENAE